MTLRLLYVPFCVGLGVFILYSRTGQFLAAFVASLIIAGVVSLLIALITRVIKSETVVPSEREMAPENPDSAKEADVQKPKPSNVRKMLGTLFTLICSALLWLIRHNEAIEANHVDHSFLVSGTQNYFLHPLDETAQKYQEAAEHGNAYAEYHLGICFFNGEGVTEDRSEAVKWFREAAGQGLMDAQYNLAVCYDKGEGVAMDKAEAKGWYQKAADQGNPDAIRRLEGMNIW